LGFNKDVLDLRTCWIRLARICNLVKDILDFKSILGKANATKVGIVGGD